jgi:hypothetical protein
MSRAKIAAYKGAVGAVADLRLALQDFEAAALAVETNGEGCAHPAALELALEDLEALPPRPEGDDDALIEWALESKKRRVAFWAAYEGTVVDGVTIIQKR